MYLLNGSLCTLNTSYCIKPIRDWEGQKVCVSVYVSNLQCTAAMASKPLESSTASEETSSRGNLRSYR